MLTRITPAGKGGGRADGCPRIHWFRPQTYFFLIYMHHRFTEKFSGPHWLQRTTVLPLTSWNVMCGENLKSDWVTNANVWMIELYSCLCKHRSLLWIFNLFVHMSFSFCYSLLVTPFEFTFTSLRHHFITSRAVQCYTNFSWLVNWIAILNNSS